MLDWDQKKMEFFIQRLKEVSKKIYICPSLLLFVNESHHPVGGQWDKDERLAIREFSENIQREELEKKIDEVYGHEPFVEEVHQTFSKARKYKDHVEKLDMVKQYQFQSNVRIARMVAKVSKEKLIQKLEKLDKSLKEFSVGEEDDMDNDEREVDELLVMLCKKHDLYHHLKTAREVIHILFKFGFKYHEIALADPRIFRIKYIDTFVQVLSEMCENTNLGYEEIVPLVEKSRDRFVSSLQLANYLRIPKKHVQEGRRFTYRYLSKDPEKVTSNVKFLIESNFDPYEILNCLSIVNFDHDLVKKVFVDTVTIFDAHAVSNSPAERVSLLCHMYLELSKPSLKPVDLDDIGYDDSVNPDLDQHLDEDDLDDLDPGYSQYSHYAL